RSIELCRIRRRRPGATRERALEIRCRRNQNGLERMTKFRNDLAKGSDFRRRTLVVDALYHRLQPGFGPHRGRHFNLPGKRLASMTAPRIVVTDHMRGPEFGERRS